MQKRALLRVAVASAAACSLVLACTDAATDLAGGDDPTDAGGRRDEAPAEARASAEDGGSYGDAGPGPDCPPLGPPLAPDLSGPRACGALDFGRAAAPFVPVDETVDASFTGGAIPPGIYDVVKAERASGNPGSWRETLVVGANGRFTRTRQIDTGSGPAPVSYRSGTISTSGGNVTLTEDCLVVDDAGADGGASTLPYEVETGACEDVTFSYGVTGFRFTFERRR